MSDRTTDTSLLPQRSAAQAPAPVVDFHCHYLGPVFPSSVLAGTAPAQREFWESVNRQLVDHDAITATIDPRLGLAARVISTPLEFVQQPGQSLPLDMVRRLNDSIAARVAEAPGRLYGLATVDAYSGEAGARELERAVRELGLRGAFIESARGDLLPDASEARPTFEAAAEWRVPLFVHPVPDLPLRRRFANCGPQRERFVRSTLNSAAVFAMVECGLFEALPGLRVVVTALALNGVLLSGRFDVANAPRNLYIDTTGLQPIAIRAAVDLLGTDRVLAGSDWPVVSDPHLSTRLDAALIAAGLDAPGRARVANANVLELLGNMMRIDPARVIPA